jgi:hypothetical protein
MVVWNNCGLKILNILLLHCKNWLKNDFKICVDLLDLLAHILIFFVK